MEPLLWGLPAERAGGKFKCFAGFGIPGWGVIWGRMVVTL